MEPLILSMLPEITISFMALAFAGMGLIALALPARVTGQFGITELQAASRNEVRAVYGGFGLVMSGMLITSLLLPGLRTGICLTVGMALLGMAGGRLVSGVLDRTLERVPLSYLLIEVVGGALLINAA